MIGDRNQLFFDDAVRFYNSSVTLQEDDFYKFNREIAAFFFAELSCHMPHHPTGERSITLIIPEKYANGWSVRNGKTRKWASSVKPIEAKKCPCEVASNWILHFYKRGYE